ncbi:hypothetical protein COT07_03290 [Candidatus Woesearchaeota archaeon CG07_land_8_20_14_0_80_44_23]|nr:MAG: hypothetical protein COT07_03290 [Candidatus Woesearchaeota archaeon CG07_land_8_20_14_0_80_44_23]
MVGNIPNYTKADIFRCLVLVSKSASREKIKEIAGLGEGSVRAILDILKNKKLISSSKRGHFLTEKGKELLKRISKTATFSEQIQTKKLFPKYKKVAVLVKKHRKIRSIVALRDVAVKNGAEGAMLLEYKNGSLSMGFSSKENLDFLRHLFKYEKGDVLIIVFGKSLRICEIAAISMLSEINNSLKFLLE